MGEITSHAPPQGRGARLGRKEWSLLLGIIASLLALTYLVEAVHARYATGTHSAESMWFPLQLFVIAISPALAGFIFLWSERHLQSRGTQKLLRNLAIFAFGLLLAGWVAVVVK